MHNAISRERKEKIIEEAEKMFIVGTIGMLLALYAFYIVNEFYITKESNGQIKYEGNMAYPIGTLIIFCIFFRMAMTGANHLGLWSSNENKNSKKA